MILASVGTVVILLILALWIGARRQQDALSAQVDRLIHAAAMAPVAAAGIQGLDAVPEPVARYLRWALRTKEHIQEVRIKQIGTLRTDVRSERWMPFEAEHIVVPPATGFVWNARVRVAPLLHVRVRDALDRGAWVWAGQPSSAFTVSADAATPEMNSGSLHRYLAKLWLCPTALLPSPTLRWTAILMLTERSRH